MLAFSSLSVFSQTEKMNVLFLMADDMRPELGCYGVKEVKTPNIDRFAASGLLFQNAYCNIPVSGASRASLLTGVYPHYPDRFVNYSAYASKDCPTAIPISRWFTSHGYYTISNGKVFHHLSDHANSSASLSIRSRLFPIPSIAIGARSSRRKISADFFCMYPCSHSSLQDLS